MLLVLVLMCCLGICVWRVVAVRDGVRVGVGGDGERSYRSELGTAAPMGDGDADAGSDEIGSPTLQTDGSTPQATAQGITVSTYAGELEQVATHLLTSYRDSQSCVLVSTGYLDLLGLVWGCVVQGDGWVDVCTVAQSQTEGTCKVSVLHMDASEVAGLFGEDDGRSMAGQ